MSDQNSLVGDEWLYTTPSGRAILHRVVDTDVAPKYQHLPGPCIRLRAKDGSIADTVTWPELLTPSVGWERFDRPTAADLARGQQLAEEHGLR